LERREAGFEDLNTDVRRTSAYRQLDGGNTIIFLSSGKKNANKSGPYLYRCAISKVCTNNCIRYPSKRAVDFYIRYYLTS